MVHPQTTSNSPLSSRIALPTALIMSALFGIGIAFVPLPQGGHAENREIPAKSGSGAASLAGKSITPVIPSPSEARAKPDESGSQELVDFCAQNVTMSRSFVVFSRGTCVVIEEPCDDPLAAAREKLKKCAIPNAQFVAERVDDGDLIIAFEQPVFHRFTRSKIETIEPWLNQSAQALLTPEESVGIRGNWQADLSAKAGLLARRWLLEDASSLKPLRIIRARQSVDGES
jgi:hypothetical protein